MGACRHGQRGTCPPPEMSVFCALVVTVKHSVDQLFMHNFHNFSSASGGFAPRPPPGWGFAPRPPPGFHPRPHWGTFVSRPPNLPTPGKNHAGTHYPVTAMLYCSNPNLAAKQKKTKEQQLKERPRFSSVAKVPIALGGFKPQP